MPTGPSGKGTHSIAPSASGVRKTTGLFTRSVSHPAGAGKPGAVGCAGLARLHLSRLEARPGVVPELLRLAARKAEHDPRLHLLRREENRVFLDALLHEGPGRVDEHGDEGEHQERPDSLPVEEG